MAAEPVVVETNWIVAVALQQHEPSTQLLDHASAGHIRLILPAVCVGEALTAIRRKRYDWEALTTDLGGARREFDRSAILEPIGGDALDAARTAVAQAADAATQNFWAVLERVVGCAQQILPTVTTIQLMNEIRSSTSLRPPDAAVLATAVELSRTGACNRLLSHDSGFTEEPVEVWLTQERITLVRDAAVITGPIAAALARGG